MVELLAKQQRLESRIREMGSTIVALSGGVDSAFLAVIAHRVLASRALAVTGESPSYSSHQRKLVQELTGRFDLQHQFIKTQEIENVDYVANGRDRCFHCKTELYQNLHNLASTLGYEVVLDGANADDRNDYRPGRKAAKELGVRSPLDEVSLRKSEIRALAKSLNVPSWEEPASACLSSRIPYQTPISIENLSAVEQAESALRRLGFKELRVRHHGAVARIELGPAEIDRAFEPDTRKRLVEDVKAAGFQYVSVDLEGYRMGSLNEISRASHPAASEVERPPPAASLRAEGVGRRPNCLNARPKAELP